jgi:hypothetical protein
VGASTARVVVITGTRDVVMVIAIARAVVGAAVAAGVMVATVIAAPRSARTAAGGAGAVAGATGGVDDRRDAVVRVVARAAVTVGAVIVRAALVNARATAAATAATAGGTGSLGCTLSAGSGAERAEAVPELGGRPSVTERARGGEQAGGGGEVGRKIGGLVAGHAELEWRSGSRLVGGLGPDVEGDDADEEHEPDDGRRQHGSACTNPCEVGVRGVVPPGRLCLKLIQLRTHVVSIGLSGLA